MTNPGGRPLKYTTEYIEEEATLLLHFFKDESKIFLKEFALDRGYPPQTISEFAQKNEKFSESLKVAKAIQEIRIAKRALLGKYNASMAKFCLMNVAGWRDQQYLENQSDHNVTYNLMRGDENDKHQCVQSTPVSKESDTVES